MEFLLTNVGADTQGADCIVVPVFTKAQLSPAAQAVDRKTNGRLSSILQRGDLEGKPGQTSLIYDAPGIGATRVLVVGCGAADDIDTAKFREIVIKANAALRSLRGVNEVAYYLSTLKVKERDGEWMLRQIVELIASGEYRFDRLKSDEERTPPSWRKTIVALPTGVNDSTAQAIVRQAQAITLGMALTKDLGNLPPNICTPTYLSEQATALGKQYGFKVTVLEVADMEQLKMGSLLSVARGSHQPAKLISIEYQGGKSGAAPVALVGKGITFDTGGISIKPAANMDEMKYDMCGAGTVLGVMKAIAEMKLPINVVGVIPTTENMPGGNASRPGDIVTSMSGQTIEILNTDAEGRLILCDALTYAEKFKPAVVIDIATLTGACVIALGAHASGLLSNDDRLANDLLAAGDYTYDRAWRLPLWDEYQKQLDTNFADMANVGGREAGTITAACFLARFTKKFKWAHLDIAGTAWKTGKEKGGTGRPVPLLTQFLINRSQQT